jgi:hypothetical protein
MRKLIFSIAAIVLVGAAVFVWSHTALVPIHASTASVSVLPTERASSRGNPAISPTDMMVNHKVSLPAEQWEPH